MITPSTPPELTPSDLRSVADRQVAILGKMAEAGLQIVLALRDQALAPADAPQIAQDIGLAYCRVSRAVRLSLALQAKVMVETIDVLNRRAAYPPPAPKPDPAPTPVMARRERVQRIVERVIAAEHDNESTAERLAGESWERLIDEDLYGDLLDRPISELVALICKDLNLSPDWTRLAQELWARQEVRSEAVGPPLAGAGAFGAAASIQPTAARHAASP